MTDKQISTYCDDVKETALRQFYKIQNQRKEISLLHKKCTLQQAEIEKLNNNISAMATTLSSSAKATRNEAIKEFADRLKEHLKGNGGLYCVTTMNAQIDNLVKEMAGEDK